MLDMTTTEVPDHLIGGVFPCTDDRFGAAIRTKLPCVISVGAVDMVNLGAMDTVPKEFRDRNLHVHNAQVTLTRTTPEENRAIGKFIVERVNKMEGPVRFFLPLKGVSAIDALGMPFHDPEADAALFDTIREGWVDAPNRELIELGNNINNSAFPDALAKAFLELIK
ncbi:MAG: Tm-1-like ATP-binding domain-containing protein [Breoghania sp.]|nr:Tm-1-like ATP-binding domain-containing protein [Breoghania sp.]MDJ0933009.1 Tm-1-like ATP-binding domain-containing protein [Breoghania sp.]